MPVGGDGPRGGEGGGVRGRTAVAKRLLPRSNVWMGVHVCIVGVKLHTHMQMWVCMLHTHMQAEFRRRSSARGTLHTRMVGMWV